MSERPKGYGMTAELNEKKAAKYDVELQVQVVDWIKAVTGDDLDILNTQEDFTEKLKNGKTLCQLINAIQPGSVKKVNDSKMAFKMVRLGWSHSFLYLHSTPSCTIPLY